MSELKTDSKKKSASEAFVNSFGGYPIGYGLGIVVFHYLQDGFKRIHIWQILQLLEYMLQLLLQGLTF